MIISKGFQSYSLRESQAQYLTHQLENVFFTLATDDATDDALGTSGSVLVHNDCVRLAIIASSMLGMVIVVSSGLKNECKEERILGTSSHRGLLYGGNECGVEFCGWN